MRCAAALMLGLLMVKCASVQDVVAPEAVQAERSESPMQLPPLPGVDSTLARNAFDMALRAIIEARDEELATSRRQKAETIVIAVDSMLNPVDANVAPTGIDTVSQATQDAAVIAFNEGAVALQEASSAPGVAADSLLAVAQQHLRSALDINPWDGEARYWLARVYEIRGTRLGETGQLAEAIDVLRQLVAMHRDRHDYVAQLASMQEALDTRSAWGMAGELWRRAAGVAEDDAELGIESELTVDSTLVWNYYLRGSRAYSEARLSAPALELLEMSENWMVSADNRAVVDAEQAWILWDDGNLDTRFEWDSLTVLIDSDPTAALPGVDGLAGRIRNRSASVEVKHRAGLLRYELGMEAEAITELHLLWRGVLSNSAGLELDERVTEDFGVLAFNFAQQRIRTGDRRSALVYLVQSEQTGWEGAARAALQQAQLLRNSVPDALAAADRAETLSDSLSSEDLRLLYQLLVSLHRQTGDTDTARTYLERFRAVGGS